MKISLQTPVSKLYGVGQSYVEKLKKLGIKKIRDLLFHFPHRYDDFSEIVPIAKLAVGQIVSIQGKILDMQNIRTYKRRMFLTEAIIQDQSGAIKAVWFNQPYLSQNLKKGMAVTLSGKVSLSHDNLVLSNPSYELGKDLIHTARLVPIYPETYGLSSRWLRFRIKSILPLASQIKDYLPQQIQDSQNLLGLSNALQQIHFPKNQDLASQARKRLAFDELFLIQLAVLNQKQKWQQRQAQPISFNKKLIQKFVKSLPFKLTNAQRKASWQILQDLEKSKPMNRLLEGDVGSGKTVVAAMAALEVAMVGAGRGLPLQVAVMAPTEILAEQHFKEIKKLLKDFNLRIGLLTSSVKINQQNPNILIGTHALIQEKHKFKNLALAIVDEQHRFGVEQRAYLQKQTQITPHLLTMTATPIPRTFALTLYGDLDISLLDEMPKGRQEIITEIVAPGNRKNSYRFILEQIKQGRQAFVICPLIEESEKLESKAAQEEYEKLNKKVFPDLRIGLLHGRMKSKEKEKVMKEFKDGKLDILVSTSVVEVGIDVPNATVMMIEGSERFGLAQLHQFRGRVGRSKYQSYCFLFTDSNARKTRQRLKAILDCSSGFELAEKDLEIRGPGEFYGTRQSGLPDLTMASLNDLDLIQKARSEAQKILPSLNQYPLLQNKLKSFKMKVHFE